MAKVSAINSVGWSDASSPNIEGVTVETTPNQAPQALQVDLDNTNESQIKILMTEMIEES